MMRAPGRSLVVSHSCKRLTNTEKQKMKYLSHHSEIAHHSKTVYVLLLWIISSQD